MVRQNIQQENIQKDIAQSIIDVLTSKKYKLTNPRLAVLDFLSGSHKLVSADEVFSGIGSRKMDRVTVYRVLDLFEKLGLLNQHISKQGVKKYELVTDHNHHCHHAICESCGETEHIEDTEIEKALEVLAKKLKKVKYVKDHTLEFFGTCTSCKTHKK